MMATAHLPTSIDSQKQRYSHELAEYTFKQYDQARQMLDSKNRSENKTPSATTNGSTNG
jgi:hypothetical protein